MDIYEFWPESILLQGGLSTPILSVPNTGSFTLLVGELYSVVTVVCVNQWETSRMLYLHLHSGLNQSLGTTGCVAGSGWMALAGSLD